MKDRRHLLTALAFFISPNSWAAEPEPSESSPTRIPGSVSGGKFTPPTPPPPPKEPPAALKIESTAVKTFPSHRLTLLRAEPSTLPDIPLPAVASPPDEAQLAAREAFLRNYRPPIQLQLSATVIDAKFSVVRWRHPQDIGVSFEAVVGLDFGVFSGVGNFLHNGIPHSLFLMHSNLNTTGIRRLHPAFQPPTYPVVQEEGFMILKGNPADAAGIAPLAKLLDLYKIEKDRLLKASAERLQAQLDSDEWRKQNPASQGPKSHTFWLRPHRGSRYLHKIQPEGGAR